MMIPELRIFDGLVRGTPEACWHWRGNVSPSGYASINGLSVHRVAYRLFVAEIPPGLVIDHVCHTLDFSCPGTEVCLHRRCVNPAHLEPVTPSENSRRGMTGRGRRPRISNSPYERMELRRQAEIAAQLVAA